MSENLTVTYQIAALIVPPTSLIFLGLLGLWLQRKRPTLGKVVIGLSLVSLLALSMPAVSFWLLKGLEADPIPNSRALEGAEAIVILAGGISHGAPEYGGETMSALTLQRVRYGALLARESKLPVLVTGGNPTGGSAEAAPMRDALIHEFGITPRWVEDHSDTTAENAQFSATLLRAAKVKKIALVTSAMHMRRAKGLFEQQGLRVVAAPTGYFAQVTFRWQYLVPSGDGLRLSYIALREWLGVAYYRLRH